MFNGSAGQLLERAPEAALGMRIQSVLPLPAELSAALDVGRAVPAPYAAPFEIDLPPADASSVTVELVVSSSTIRTVRRARRGAGEPRRVLIFTFRDVSERRQAMAAQIAATEEAMAANRAKSEFLTNMSHELRTPLNAIIGFSEMICEQVFGPVGDAHYLSYAKDIRDSGSHLRDVVNDILDVSKIEAGKVELNEEPVDPARIAYACLHIVAARAEQAELRLVSDLPSDTGHLVADERMVKQCLLNLLSNAIKFTPKGGSVSLSVRRDPDGSLALCVADTGIGIAAEHLPHLTEPFYQTDGSLARTHEGTGLGLYLVHKFMAQHGGDLLVESEPGKGTMATLQFPADRVAGLQSAHAA